MKKGFELNLMVVGQSGLGKSTLVNCLFNTRILSKPEKPSRKFMKEDVVDIKTHVVDIDEKGVKLKLTVITTDGFGDGLDSSKSPQPISEYVDRQYEKYFDFENGLNRRSMVDTRVHCCFYFISADCWSLTPLDITLMTELHDKVNIIPLIAKADMLTAAELKEKKKRIREDLNEYGIKVYEIPDDVEEDEDYKKTMHQLKSSMPFGVSASLETHDVKGREVLGRKLAFGIHEVENPDHSDFSRLKTLIVTHMHDLRDVTHEVHYENYRAQRLSGLKSRPAGSILETSLDDENFDSVSTCASQFSIEKERLLREKEIELQKMAEKMKQYEEQLRLQQQEMFHRQQLMQQDN